MTGRCDAPLLGSSCQVNLVLTTPGTWNVVAHTPFYGETASMTETVVATPAVSATTVDQVAEPIANGANVTLTAHVSVVGGFTPTGTVQFKDNGSNLGTAVNVNASGVATRTQALANGAHAITAVYAPTPSGIAASTAAATNFLVGGPGAVTNLHASIRTATRWT